MDDLNWCLEAFGILGATAAKVDNGESPCLQVAVVA
jgi:hypothetical protein